MKNTAYGDHSTSWGVWIEAPMPKNPKNHNKYVLFLQSFSLWIKYISKKSFSLFFCYCQHCCCGPHHCHNYRCHHCCHCRRCHHHYHHHTRSLNSTPLTVQGDGKKSVVFIISYIYEYFIGLEDWDLIFILICIPISIWIWLIKALINLSFV